VLSPDLKVIRIIEINNPPPTAGCSLFNWKTEYDLIVNGPFTFRIIEKPLDNPKDLIHPPLKHFINLQRGISSKDLSHLKFSCNNCHKHPISEEWYHCKECDDYDFCDTCYASKHTHPVDHAFCKYTTSEPKQQQQPEPEPASTASTGCCVM